MNLASSVWKPQTKQSRLVLCALLYCMFVWVSRGGNAWAAHRQTAVLFVVFGIEGLRLLTTQFVVWEPHFDIICKHGELGDLLGGKFAPSKSKEFCYIFISCYFPLHVGSD